MLKEFKEFAVRGNVADLAVGVIIGAAFNGIVQSLVGDIFTPVIGAITGGGKGAAIGAGAGAAAGAGTQLLTRGRSVSVPAESLLTFRLGQDLAVGVADTGFMRNGSHYHRY